MLWKIFSLTILVTVSNCLAVPTGTSGTVQIEANWYQQFDADYQLEVPAEGYGGWQRGPIEIAPRHTALVVMHAWQCGSQQEFPGWYRCVEYIPRSQRIAAAEFPAILKAARASAMRVYHVVGGGEYYRELPGYLDTAKYDQREPIEQIAPDAILTQLRTFRSKHVFPGEHNAKDVSAGFAVNDFLSEARPVGREPVAETTEQLFAICKRDGVNHLIYIGFALNACLTSSPGGMVDMNRHGLMCSTINEATLSVENRETARDHLEHRQALWRVAVFYGFVFNAADFIRALQSTR